MTSGCCLSGLFACAGFGYLGREKLKAGGIVRPASEGPLAGLTVIDASVVIAVPSAAALLAELGAEVIKLECMDLPDSARGIGPAPAPGMAGLVCGTARGKQSIIADLKSPGGQEVLTKLVQKADIFCQNFRPGAVEKLGADYESLKKINPNIIYVTSTGFGQSGPYSTKRVYDMLIQSLSGLTSFNDPAHPKLTSHAVHDKCTGQMIANSVLSALYARERGAGGQHLIISMIDAALHWMWADVYYNFTWDGLPQQPQINALLPGAKDNTLLDNDQAIAAGEGKNWYEAEHLLFGKFRSPKSPFTFSATPLAGRPCAPMLGEHTNKILTSLGYKAENIAEMLEKKNVTSTAAILKMKKDDKKEKVFKVVELVQGGPTFGEPKPSNLSKAGVKAITAGKPALSGLRVLDATSLIAGPLCCALLADDGADVIKLETPECDIARRVGPSPAGVPMGAMFMAANRSKRSIVAASKDGGVAQRLASTCDVVVVDGTIAIDEAAVRKAKANVIFVQINKGPGDFAIQASCGMVAEQVDDQGKKFIPPSLNAEKAAAFYAASAIKAALFANLQGVEGQNVTIDMEQAAWHTYFIDGMWGHSWLAPKAPPKFPSISALFNVLIATSKDGRYCFTGCLSDKEWKEWLASDIGKRHPPTPENLEKWSKGIGVRLGDMTNFTSYFKNIVIQYNYRDYEVLAEKDGLICALCTTPEEALAHPQIKHNQSVGTYSHPQLGSFQLANHPMKYSATPPRPFTPAPLPGQHTLEILSEAGFSAAEVQALVAQSAVIVAK